MPLEDAPSYRQGFGRLSLLHSLPLPGAAGSPGWRLQVVDGASLAQGEQHNFCVQASGGPLRVTLAWYDWPGDPAASRALVNNLDLVVRAAGRGGLVDPGNGHTDNVNTVEQVWYEDLAAGDVAISVSAPTVFSRAGRQPYALVVQGTFGGTLQPPSGNGSSPATCAVRLAVIEDTLSSPLLTNRNWKPGRDAAGNMGPPTNVPFRTDLSPPAISASVPPALAASSLGWDYSVDDGPSGTGVVNVSCSFRWLYLVDISNQTRGNSTHPPATRTAQWVQPCPNPVRYTVQEGSFLWSIAATDGAGLRATADFPLVVDFTPPVSRVFASALPPGRSLPSRARREGEARSVVDSEQAAIDAAIAASLASAAADQRRQHSALRAQLQPQPQSGGPPRPPSQSLL
ncbi:hypothetical protein GPECTOR_49g540 [Gonium pectorale]|uniref:Uncharacterized protein n=1 Tax=Gonium pectorale TaxID=33097 RepID=A0A150G7W4_GONPE|nr:hypothetical protein GPECTOR_49g540 [Gonium pectorale]|eukprot:KXZ45956.1 hypothetical protein GPECTOR_49g540 [Gonium pectorale]